MFVDTFITRPILATVCSLVIVLAGVLVPEERDLELSKAIDDLRAYLGRPPHKPLHFRDLKHAAKRAAMLRLAGYDFVFSGLSLRSRL